MGMLPAINPQKEKKRIVSFLKKTFKKQKIGKVVLGVSGGVDSTTCLYLLKEAVSEKNIIAVSLPYFQTTQTISLVNYPVISIPIRKITNQITKDLNIKNNHLYNGRIRVGNIMARVRMVILFDLAKKHNALVCGTENKTEYLLGYYTRFGDEASDIEPIKHLYKTQVRQLAGYLGVPDQIINQRPTAGLWSLQTDEAEFGFPYEEADNVLYLYFDKKISTEQIIKMGYPHAKKILAFVKKNEFKRKTPYCLYQTKLYRRRG